MTEKPIPLDTLSGGTPWSLEIRTGVVPISATDTLPLGWSFDTPIGGDDYAVAFYAYPLSNAVPFTVAQAPRLQATDLTPAGFQMLVADALDCLVQYVAIRTTRNVFQS